MKGLERNEFSDDRLLILKLSLSYTRRFIGFWKWRCESSYSYWDGSYFEVGGAW